MMSAETGTCISLSETGGRVWELLEEPCTVGGLCTALAEEYEADPAVLRDDVVELVRRLQAEQAAVIT